MTDQETALARMDERIKALEKTAEAQQKELISLRPLRSLVASNREAIKYHWFLLGGLVTGLIGMALRVFRGVP